MVILKKTLISGLFICLVLLTGCGGGEKETETKSHDVILTYPDFFTNTQHFTYEFSKEELIEPLKQINKNIENELDLSSVVATTTEGSTVDLKMKGDTLTVEFDNGQSSIHESNGFQTEVFHYPLELTFKNVSPERAVRIETNEYNVFMVDLYNGKLVPGTIFKEVGVNENEIKDAILSQVFEFKEEAWKNEQVTSHILNVESSAEDQAKTAKTAYEYMRNTFKYNEDQANIIKNGLIGAGTLKGVKNMAQDLTGTCHQFALLYKLMLDSNDIENRLVYGNFNGEEGVINHVWNEVNINGEWISVDTTGNGFGQEGQYDKYIAVKHMNL